PRPGFGAPAIDYALLELGSDPWKRVGDEIDARGHARLGRRTASAAHRARSRGSENPARGRDLIARRIPDFGRPVGSRRTAQPRRRPETVLHLQQEANAIVVREL